jgi:hypothetical protein
LVSAYVYFARSLAVGPEAVKGCLLFSLPKIHQEGAQTHAAKRNQPSEGTNSAASATHSPPSARKLTTDQLDASSWSGAQAQQRLAKRRWLLFNEQA